MSTLSAFLTARCPQLAAADLDARLDALVAAARAAWPGLGLEDHAFVAHVAERLPPDADAQTLSALHAADLYLACACAHKLPPAIAAFERLHLIAVGAAIARIDRSCDFVDEVRQRLRERLLTGATPRISEYSGTGPLGGWLRVAAVRIALNTAREARRSAQPRGHGAPTGNPELDIINGQYRAQVEAAFRAAFARLGGDDRELLRLHYVEGVRQGALGRRYGIDRTTANRRVAAVRRRLVDETHRELGRLVPSITTRSRDSLLHALRSQIDFGLESVLAAK